MQSHLERAQQLLAQCEETPSMVLTTADIGIMAIAHVLLGAAEGEFTLKTNTMPFASAKSSKAKL